MEELQAQKVKLELAQAILKNEAKFGKTNTIDVPEVVTESYRLQAMMAEIEKEIEDGEERSIVDSKLFSNPYQNDEFQAR